MSIRPIDSRQRASRACSASPRCGSQDLQSRIADRITRFAGSMLFVYVHVVWFGALDRPRRSSGYPFGLLTMIVSLEAIFLSTFVMISQNRADEKRRVLADQEWQFVQTEEQQNEELLALSKQILDLTTAIHQMTTQPPSASSPERPAEPRAASPRRRARRRCRPRARGAPRRRSPTRVRSAARPATSARVSTPDSRHAATVFAGSAGVVGDRGGRQLDRAEHARGPDLAHQRMRRRAARARRPAPSRARARVRTGPRAP